jgi:hypothetical protein
MSTDFSIEPVGAPADQSANDAVASELPAAQSITAVVCRVVDVRTNADEAVLRRRAYFRALDQAGRAPKRLLVTDRMA